MIKAAKPQLVREEMTCAESKAKAGETVDSDVNEPNHRPSEGSSFPVNFAR